MKITYDKEEVQKIILEYTNNRFDTKVNTVKTDSYMPLPSVTVWYEEPPKQENEAL